MSHNAPARFLYGVRLPPLSKLQQITYATTRKRARVCGRGISPLAYCRTPRRELHPTYRTIRDMFNCLLTTNCFPAFAPQLSAFRSLSGISMLGFYIAFNNRPFGLVTKVFSVSRIVTTLPLLPTPIPLLFHSFYRYQGMFGADGGSRTHNLLFTRQMRCLLRHASLVEQQRIELWSCETRFGFSPQSTPFLPRARDRGGGLYHGSTPRIAYIASPR